MISETTLAKLEDNPENTLDLILFNTQTIAQQYSQELKKQQSETLEFLSLEIKTVEAQLDAMNLQNPPTQPHSKIFWGIWELYSQPQSLLMDKFCQLNHIFDWIKKVLLYFMDKFSLLH